jgi:hypothetical protein
MNRKYNIIMEEKEIDFPYLSSETNFPVRWVSVTNVGWKNAVPDKGYSSPAIRKNKVSIHPGLSSN